MMSSNVVSVFCITFLIFVDWKKGSQWWLKISPYVCYVMILANYLLIPIVNLIPAIYYLFAPNLVLKDFTIESYVIYYGILCLCKIVEYFTLIRKYVLKDALVHLEYGRVLNEGVTSIEELLANE